MICPFVGLLYLTFIYPFSRLVEGCILSQMVADGLGVAVELRDVASDTAL